MLERKLLDKDPIISNVLKSIGYYVICEPANKEHWNKETNY